MQVKRGFGRYRSRIFIGLILATMSIGIGPAFAHDLTISHTPVTSASAGQDLVLTFAVNSDCSAVVEQHTFSGVTANKSCDAPQATVYYTTSDGVHKNVAAVLSTPDSQGRSAARATIPAADMKAGTTRYYIWAQQWQRDTHAYVFGGCNPRFDVAADGGHWAGTSDPERSVSVSGSSTVRPGKGRK